MVEKGRGWPTHYFLTVAGYRHLPPAGYAMTTATAAGSGTIAAVTTTLVVVQALVILALLYRAHAWGCTTATRRSRLV